jgi:hypothetical protein
MLIWLLQAGTLMRSKVKSSRSNGEIGPPTEQPLPDNTCWNSHIFLFGENNLRKSMLKIL